MEIREEKREVEKENNEYNKKKKQIDGRTENGIVSKGLEWRKKCFGGGQGGWWGRGRGNFRGWFFWVIF